MKLAVASLLVAGFLVACGGGGGTSSTGTPSPVGGGETPVPPVVSKLYTNLETREEASRFLIQAGFGGTDDQIDALVGTDAADWIANEISKPATMTLAAMQARHVDGTDTESIHSQMLWQNLLTADDHLRQRMLYAMSQIFVISTDAFFNEGFKSAYYTDILTNQAFGNYRSLLEEITYSPAMGEYLTYYRNIKGDLQSGRSPDENYAREILQLFSIGLVELEIDGSPKPGSPETYDNDDIVGLARVFTGLSGAGESFRLIDQSEGWRHHPMQMFDENHSALEKSFLGTTIPANTGGTDSITLALDTIADHANVAPFLARQLIQRFTASSPSEDYVQRVAEVWNAGFYNAPNGQEFGEGQRGDLQAVIAAILLDESVHDDVQESNEGKIREPVLKLIHFIRSFETSEIDVYNLTPLHDTRDPSTRLGQHPFRSPSVFNFYRPGYLAPSSETGEQGLTAPEFQIVNEATSLGFTNLVGILAIRRIENPNDTRGLLPSFATEINLADDVEALVDHLDVKLTAGQLSDLVKAEISDVVSGIVIAGNDMDVDRRKRVQTAVLMVTASGAFSVQN